MDNERKPVAMQFAAIEKTIQKYLPDSTQKKQSSNRYVQYGENDGYLNFIWDTYQECTTLQSIIQAYIDYGIGNGVEGLETVNSRGEQAEDLIMKLIADYNLFGAFAIQVIRNNKGDVSDLYHIDVRYLRSDADNECFWYNKDFGKRWGRTSKSIVLPKFIPGAKDVPNSVVYVKNPMSRDTYGEIPWRGAVSDAIIENKISKYNLAQIANGFSASYMITFNNGIPEDTQKAQIEREIMEKFCGEDNAGRILLNFSNGKDNAAQVDKLDTENFKDRFEVLARWTRQGLFTAFGVNGNLIGVPTESNGFNSEEYESSFKIFNRTRIRPQQMLLMRTFSHIYGKDTISFKPFTLGGD